MLFIPSDTVPLSPGLDVSSGTLKNKMGMTNREIVSFLIDRLQANACMNPKNMPLGQTFRNEVFNIGSWR